MRCSRLSCLCIGIEQARLATLIFKHIREGSLSTIGQPELLKAINRSHAFEALKRSRVISRTELAKQTQLSRATISLLADDLLESKLAEEVGHRDSTGGRPAMMLRFNPEAAYSLGALMYDRKWVIVLTDLDAKVIHRTEVSIGDDTPQTAVAMLKLGVDALVNQNGRQQILSAIGVGTPGLVDMRTGVIQNAVDMGWFEVPFKAMVEEALSIQTFVANRSKVGALAELWHGTSANRNNIVYISIGTGVAAGIVEKGELYIGSNSSAGELGHMTVLPDGPLCRCGNRGCLQQLVSGPAIVNMTRERLRRDDTSLLNAMLANSPERLTVQMIFQAAEQGDPLAAGVVGDAATYLGIAIANLINLLNPDQIILGGPVGQVGGVLLKPIREEVQRRAMVYPLSVATIRTSTLGPDAGAIGASVLVLQRTCDLMFPRSIRNRSTPQIKRNS